MLLTQVSQVLQNNNEFLKFIANVFNSKIVKCREQHLRFLISAIDYLNKWTNDCFFCFDRKSINVINYSGKLMAEAKPI